MGQPLISVIIPVYNAVNTIERCVKSIVTQKAAIEIICIDDGSKDGSLELLNKLTEEDDRLIIVHQANAGAGAARNTGLNSASGKYIMFCDADDVYQPGTIDYITEDIENFSPDYIVFLRQTVLLDGKLQTWGNGSGAQVLTLAWDRYLNERMLPSGQSVCVVTRVFRHDIISEHGIGFAKFRFGEDFWFLLTYLPHCEVLVEDYRAIYLQYQNVGSICQSSYHNYYDLNMECVRAFQRDYPAETSRITSFINHFQYRAVINSVNRVLNGVDASSISKKRSMLNELLSKEEVRKVLAEVPAFSWAKPHDIKYSKYLLRQQTIRYAFSAIYIGKSKAFVRRLLGRY